MNSITKILICYNEPVKFYSNYSGKNVYADSDDTDLSETETFNHIENTINTLSIYHNSVEILPFNSDVEDVIKKIRKFDPDVIFNLVETVDGISNYEAYAVGVYELLGISYTGNTPICLGTCLNKSRTKLILSSAGIQTPNHLVAKYNSKPEDESFTLKFPVIMKLLNEDASIGISEFSVANDIDEVRNRLKFLFKTYKQDVLIEEYIDGREFNVAILGDKALPISEIDFTGLPEELPKIVTYEGKWSAESTYYKYTKPVCPAVLNNKIRQKIESVALEAYKTLGCRDYARVDIRLSKNNTPYVIEINPNPDISSDSGFARAIAAAGISYAEFLNTLIEFAYSRRNEL